MRNQNVLPYLFRRQGRMPWVRVSACLAVVLASPLAAGVLHGQSANNSAIWQDRFHDTSDHSKPTNPGGMDQNVPNGTDDQKRLAALNAQRQKQMTEDTAKLLVLAGELKDEMDKSNKDTLSLGVLKKAEQIEKLAHSVREKMKASIAVR